MPKWVKSLVAVLLLPVCLGTSQALFRVVQAAGREVEASVGHPTAGNADTVWVPLVAGAACWLVIYLLLPRPMRAYVFGHELTHVLWTWLFGGRVKRFRASAAGGHVVVTRINFLITLSPYFFPLYAVLVVLVLAVGSLFWSWWPHRVWCLLLLGAAYAFHVTLTCHALRTEQTDITDQGYLFSAVVIWLGNLSVLLLGLPLLTQVGYGSVAAWCVEGTADVFRAVAGLVGRWF